MLNTLKKKFFWLKSRTVRWMGLYLPSIGVALEALRSELPTLEEYIPSGLYRGIVLAGIVALVLRLATTKPLDAYKEGGE